VQGLWFGYQGIRSQTEGLGLRISVTGIRAQDPRFMAW
jgi:hypothetical protein